MTALGVEACVAQAMAADGSASAEVKRELSSYSLLTICRAMKEYLCEVDKVQPAMRLLASTAVDRPTLAKTDVHLLFTFFSEKLAQLEYQTAALSCLALLIAEIRTRFECGADWFDIVALPFVRCVRVQQLPLNCRKQCFGVMTFLFTDATLPACNSDTLAALLDLLDGESDPELVLQTFDLHVVVAARASAAAFAPVLDDYFESISSYFPVVFSQPPGCRVTKADLRTHLKRCLCLAVYSECCIPFMQGKLASPSIAVKEDVVDVLLTCFDTYRHGTLKPYYASLVLHMKNEVVKLSSFSDRASSPALTKCMFMCCEVLGRVSNACEVKSQSEALEIFGPVLEGYLSALSAGTSVTSAYATMAFHVLTGSWNCCLFVASYLFSMLAMSLADAEQPANAYMLFAALVAGMLDALAAFPDEGHVATLRSSIERSTAPVAEAVQQCAAQWGPSPDTSGGMDDFAVVCGCEFVVSVLKLSARLRPWLPAEVEAAGVDALVSAALHRSAEAAAKVCKLLRDLAESDNEDGGSGGVRAGLRRLLRSPDVPPERGLTVVCELASCSTEALLLAYDEGFLSPACAWMAHVAPAQKAAAFQTALDHFGDALQDSEAVRMTAVLTRDGVPPAYFQCACFVATNLSDASCTRLVSGADATALSLLGMGAVLASRRNVPGPPERWSAAVAQLRSLTSSEDLAWRRVGMEGLTGAVMNGVDGDDVRNTTTSTAAALSCDARLLVAVAVLWGGLLAAGADPHSSNTSGADEEADGRHAALVSSFAQEYLSGSDAPTSTVTFNSAAVVEAFTYLPFLAQHSASRPSLLRLLLAAGKAQSLHAGTAFCTAVQCLVSGETATQVQRSLPDLLEVLTHLAHTSSNDGGGGDGHDVLARALLFSVSAQCDADPLLARAVLFRAPTMRVLTAGATDTQLATRQRSLQLLTSLARGAVAIAGSGSPEEKATLTAVRDDVLRVVKIALGDHKRKVRQAAGACAHEWFKVR